jgi:hypothetical protein
MSQAKTTKKKTGRPPKPPGEKWTYVATRLQPEDLARLDAYVAPGQTRNEVLRELALEALTARGKADTRRRKATRGGT